MCEKVEFMVVEPDEILASLQTPTDKKGGGKS